MKILYIAPGNNPHTWKWVGWFAEKYPGEITLLPYQDPVPKSLLKNVEIISPIIPPYKIASINMFEKRRVRAMVDEIQPDLLHALWGYGAANYAAWSEFHPFLVSPWGSEITVFPHRKGPKGKIQKDLIIDALTKADGVTATSKYLRNAIMDLAPEIPQPEIFHYGVDTSVFKPSSVEKPMRFDWHKDAPSGKDVITVGQFKALKPTYGPDLLLQAAAEALKKMPGLRFVIAGDGAMERDLKKLASKLKISDHVVFTGNIPHSEMPDALAAVDIVTMPSRYEVFGVSALEASAMEKPVILTNVWGIVEVALGGKTGYFIEPDDFESLADKIIVLAQNPEQRRKMGRAGREFVREKYEFKTIMESADEYCRKLVRKFK